MNLVHLTASTFFGGPERQMLGLAEALSDARTIFASFAEGGRCREFLREARQRGFAATRLRHDTPHLRLAVREVTALLRNQSADALLCHGYKANLLGRIAARRVSIPAVAVSRGWTGEDRKVRFYESLDRWHLRRMDHIVSVSAGQAEKVFAAGASLNKVSVIRNAARFTANIPNPADRRQLRSLFPVEPRHVVLAAGRLSPEKGFDVLVEAASRVENAAFVLFGEGVERAKLEAMIRERGLNGRFMLAGHTTRLDRYLPWADVVVLPSHTEGLPNVALEASAAGVAVVATAVGGTPEVVADGETGWLVPAGDAAAVGIRVQSLLDDAALRRRFGDAGRRRMREQFTFQAQAAQYRKLLTKLTQRVRLAA